jgi:hypothetical protein
VGPGSNAAQVHTLVIEQPVVMYTLGSWLDLDKRSLAGRRHSRPTTSRSMSPMRPGTSKLLRMHVPVGSSARNCARTRASPCRPAARRYATPAVCRTAPVGCDSAQESCLLASLDGKRRTIQIAESMQYKRCLLGERCSSQVCLQYAARQITERPTTGLDVPRRPWLARLEPGLDPWANRQWRTGVFHQYCRHRPS